MQQYSSNLHFSQEEESIQIKKKDFEFNNNDAPYQQQFFGIGEYHQDPQININFDQQESYKSIDLFLNDDEDNKNDDLFDREHLFDHQVIDFEFSNQNQQENVPPQAFELQNQEQNKDIDSMRMSHPMPSIEHHCQEQYEQQIQQININNYFQNIQYQQQQEIKIKSQPQPIQHKKIKRKSNGQKDIFKTKNIPKVFGNAFRNYVSSNSAHVQHVCSLNNVNFKDFNNFVKKLNFYSIKGMREAFQQSPDDFRADQLKKIYRILVNKFLREDTWTWFLSNKRISNCRRLCNFRFYILRGLSCPSAFISWED